MMQSLNAVLEGRSFCKSAGKKQRHLEGEFSPQRTFHQKVRISHLLRNSIGHSLNAYFFLRLGKNIEKVIFLDFSLFCILNISIFSLKLPRMYISKLSSKFPSSSQLTDPNVDLLTLTTVLGLLPYFIFPLNMCLHNSQLSSNDNFTMC